MPRLVVDTGEDAEDEDEEWKSEEKEKQSRARQVNTDHTNSFCLNNNTKQDSTH